MNKPMTTMLMLSLCLMTACTVSDMDGAENTQGDVFSSQSSPADVIAERRSAGKADDAARCGEDLCARSLCGYDCATAGQQCVRACAFEDARPDTFVRASITGSEDMALDSRNYEYKPVLSLNNALFYGCDVWDFSSQERDGFEVNYREVFQGAFAVGDPKHIGADLTIYVEPFEGPGSYPAQLIFTTSSDARAEGIGWSQKEACLMSVDVTAEGGLKGSFTCEGVPNHKTEATIDVEGEFQCGVNAMRTLINAMN